LDALHFFDFAPCNVEHSYLPERCADVPEAPDDRVV
jgi:hypothetical protein